MKRKNSLTVILFTIFIIAISIVYSLAETTTKEIQDDASVSVHETPAQQPPKPKQHIDPFNIAIVGISLGCMMFSASINRNRMQRRQLEAKIQELDSFLASNCAVEFYINGCSDNDPMINSVMNIQEKSDLKIKEFEQHRNIMVKSIAEIETEVMRLWG